MSLNKAMLIGNLTRDPEAKNLPSGQPVVNFSLATNRKWKNASTGELQEDTQFHNVVVFGKLADICSRYLKKGMQIFIEGRIQTRNWDDPQSGKKQYRTEIIAEEMKMLTRKEGASNYGANASSATQQTQDNDISIPSPEQIPTIDINKDQEDIKIEDIPF